MLAIAGGIILAFIIMSAFTTVAGVVIVLLESHSDK